MRYQTANRHPRARVEQRQHRLKHRTTDIFEIDVDAVRAGSPQVLGENWVTGARYRRRSRVPLPYSGTLLADTK